MINVLMPFILLACLLGLICIILYFVSLLLNYFKIVPPVSYVVLILIAILLLLLGFRQMGWA